jgi:glycosyltransferase involved in cell wall biosynthesis
LKVAHICVVTPGRCGLYETTRELVSGLRGLGVDSRLIDVPAANKVYSQGFPEKIDRGAPVDTMEWAVKADIIVSHSGFDGTPVSETNQPIVHICHGRPRSSFLSERGGSTPIYTYLYNKNFDDRFKAVVTFWPEHVKYWDVMMPDKPIYCVPAAVDLNHWRPGPTDYDFHGNKGDFNIVLTDAWRDDVDPFLPLNAAALYAREKNATIHVYAVPEDRKGFKPLLHRIRKDGNLGELVAWTDKLRDVYRAADVMFTANTINTRSVREAMACGCPVVRIGEDLQVGPIVDRHTVRARAEKAFDLQRFAMEFKQILDGVA